VASLARVYLALFAAMLIIVLGVLMAIQLPAAYSPPAPISTGFGRVSSGQPTNPLPTRLADVSGGSRDLPPERLTVSQRRP